MRWLLFALLLGAVLQSWGQKFPKVVGELPKLRYELPKRGVCPKLPQCLFESGPVDQQFKCPGKAIMWLCMQQYCTRIVFAALECCSAHAHGPPIRIKARNMAEAITSAVEQTNLYWVLLDRKSHYLMVGRPSEWGGIE